MAPEIVTPSVTGADLDELLGVEPRTVALVAETAPRPSNPHLRYAELDSHGFALVDVTAGRVAGAARPAAASADGRAGCGVRRTATAPKIGDADIAARVTAGC